MGPWQLAKRAARRARRTIRTIASPPRPVDERSVRLVPCNDLLLLLDPTSQVVDRAIITHGSWESEQQAFLLTAAYSLTSQSAGEAIFLDIGAYFGLYALRMARSGVFQRIVAIEGDRRNYAQLRSNVFINALDRKIDCFEIAVSDGAWDMHFRHSEAHPEGNRAGVGHVEHDFHLAEKKKTVLVDDVVSASGALVIAKIDVEGHELRVIRGMRRLIENNRVLLQVECFDNAVELHDRFLPSLGLRRINRIEVDSYWTNIPDLPPVLDSRS